MPPVGKPFRAGPAAALLALAATVAVGFAPPAAAVTRFQRSVFTAFSPSDCQPATPPSAGGSAYLCPGLEGYPIYYAEAFNRAYLGLGTEAPSSKAATQTLAAANTLRPRPARRITVEWRVVIRNGRNVPYAAIVRAFTADKGEKGQVLIVFRVAGSEACHAAYVDALANEQPIVRAHVFADEDARAFDCSQPARVLGETGLSPM